MLSKLVKHELKATARLLLPIYIVLAVLTILDRIVLNLDIFTGSLAVIPGFITVMYVLAILAIFVVSSVIIILRFYKNFMTDEGYLMFTLPVKSHQLINSKLIISTFWTLVSMVAVILSLLGVFATPDRMDLLGEGLKFVKAELSAQFGTSNFTLLLVEMVVYLFIGILNSILMIYISIAIGQLLSGHKIIGSFAAYIGIYTVLQIISMVFLVLYGIIFDTSITEMSSIPQLLMPFSIISTIILTILFYVGTDFIFKKKINLE